MDSDNFKSILINTLIRKNLLNGFLTVFIILMSTLSCEELLELDLIPPKVSITFPMNESTVSEIVGITCVATDNKEIKKVNLWVDGKTVDGCEDSSEPYELFWNTTRCENNSTHTITVRAEDRSGNIADSEPVILTVDNTGALPTPVNFLPVIFKNNTFILSWNSCLDLDFYAYSIFQSANRDMSDKILIYSTSNVSDTTYIVEDIELNEVRYFQISVQDSFQLESFSNIQCAFSYYQGLVGYYPFIGNANDESDYTNHGNLFGVSFVSDRFGKTGKAIKFDGLSSFAEIPYANQTDFDAYEDSYTFALWIKSYLPDRCFILEKWNGYKSIPYPILIWADTTICCAAVYDTEKKYELCFGNICDNNWHHIAFVVDKKTKNVLFYTDGDFVGSIPNQVASSTNNMLDFKIGRATLTETRYYKGCIDDLFIFNRALNTEEISALSNISN